MTVIGVGNDFRGDDAAGLIVARAVRERAPRGVVVHELGRDATALLELWAGSMQAVVVDAMRSGRQAGTVVRFDGLDEDQWPPGARGALTSSHAFGVLEAVELGRRLSLLPASLAIYGIEGTSFDVGAPLSPPVADAVRGVVDRILAEAGLQA